MLPKDFRLAARSLRRSPGFAALTVATIALGVSATATLFSIVYGVALRPLPYRDSERLVWLAERNDQMESMRVAYRNFLDWSAAAKSLESAAAYGNEPTPVSSTRASTRVDVAAVSPEFFRVLGAKPVFGRLLSDTDHKVGAPPRCLISPALGRRLFGVDSAIVGSTIKILGGLPFEIAGVMPEDFGFPDHTGVWIPIEYFNESLDSRTAHNYLAIGRLRPGVNADSAQREVSAITRRLKAENPGPYQARDAEVANLREHLAESSRPVLTVLSAAVLILLLLVCVNVANLLLAKGTARAEEYALRSALGASRLRLALQVSSEALVLSAFGAMLGAAFSSLMLQALPMIVAQVAPDIPRIETVAFGYPAIAAAIATATIAGLLFSILPVWFALQTSEDTRLRQAGRTQTGTKQSRLIRRTLVISEIALASTLLAGSGLLIRSFTNLQKEHLGFSAANVLTAELIFPVHSSGPPASRAPQLDDIMAKVSALPGVRAAGFTSALPLSGDMRIGHFTVQAGASAPGRQTDAYFRAAAGSYFKAIGARVLRGRVFDARDGADTPGIVVINEAMARRFWPSGDALGHRIWFDSFSPDGKPYWMTIIGVVEGMREQRPGIAPAPAAYVLTTQHRNQQIFTVLTVRSSDPIDNLAAAVRRAVLAVDPDTSIAFDTLEHRVALSLAHEHLQMRVLISFAGAALLLASIGIYGVLSLLVSERRKEFAIRIVLGANARAILLAVAREALQLSFGGAVCGFGLSLGIAQLLRSRLYGIAPTDLATYAAALLTLFAAVLLASYTPAQRAVTIEPASTLKADG